LILIDTSVWIEAERKRPQALYRLAELMESGEAAVSAVTVHELLRSPKLPTRWRAFYLELFALLPVLDLTSEAAQAGATIWAGRARDDPADTADALIAGTATAVGLTAITCDAGFLGLMPTAELLRRA
jgi:predicted nucleic acid-binding protein